MNILDRQPQRGSVNGPTGTARRRPWVGSLVKRPQLHRGGVEICNRWGRIPPAAVLIVFLCNLPVAGRQSLKSVSADKASAATTAGQMDVPTVPEEDARYRIGPGDILDIRILNRPNLSREAVRGSFTGAHIVYGRGFNLNDG